MGFDRGFETVRSRRSAIASAYVAPVLSWVEVAQDIGASHIWLNGDSLDDVGGSSDPVEYEDTVSWVSGPNGRSAVDCGTIALVGDTSDISVSSGLSIEFWVKDSKTSGSYRTMFHGFGAKFYINNSTFKAEDSSGPNDVMISGSDLPNGSWRQVVVVNSSPPKVYVDGVAAVLPLYGFSFTDSSVVTLGAVNFTGGVFGSYYSGDVSSVAVYPSVLSVVDIARLYSAVG